MPPLCIPTVAAILADPAGRVLLMQRDEKPGLEFAGWWTLPGGKVEDGETPTEAIRREVQEELNLTLPLTHWTTYERPHHKPLDGHAVIIVQYVFTGVVKQAVESITLGEGQALGAFGLDDIAALRVAYGFDDLLHQFFVTYKDAI